MSIECLTIDQLQDLLGSFKARHGSKYRASGILVFGLLRLAVRRLGAMGVRHVSAHGSFQVNAEQLFDICENDIPAMIETVGNMIEDIERGPA
jgi:hypothetical protein